MTMKFLLFLAFLVSCAFCDGEAVVVLTEETFQSTIDNNEFVLVEFYAPWCGHCKALAPEYEKAAQQLADAGSDIVLANVDATVDSDLAGKFDIRGYPTLKFFRSGSPVDYDGGRTAETIVQWVTKKSGPASVRVTSNEELETFLAGPGAKVVVYLTEESEPFETWMNTAKDEKLDTFSFAHVTNLDLGSEGTVDLYNEGEKLTFDGGDITKTKLVKWIWAEGFPLVSELDQESWQRASSSKTPLLAVFGAEGDEEIFAAGKTVAKNNKGEMVGTQSTNTGLAERFGASGQVIPTAIYVTWSEAGEPNFNIFNEESGEAVTAESIQKIIDEVKAGTFVSYKKSEAIPESNDGPVTVVVGKTFDELVAKSGKNVLLEFYAPWCGHCKKLAPTYEELGEHFKGTDDVVIAKMDGTANAIPDGITVTGFPTLIFFTAKGEQLPFNGARDLEALTAFVESNSVHDEKTDL